MTLKLRATRLAPPAYAHLKEYVVLSANWRIGSISGRARESGLHDYRHEKEAAHGNQADARLRRVGHHHCDAPDQGQSSDNSYSGPSHLAVPRKRSPARTRSPSRLRLFNAFLGPEAPANRLQAHGSAPGGG
jgi:hypothetical protein